MSPVLIATTHFMYTNNNCSTEGICDQMSDEEPEEKDSLHHLQFGYL